MSGRLRTIGITALAVLGLMPAPAARAQGCVLCYTSLSNANPGALHAFMVAMVVLLIPALLLFAGVFLLVLRRAAAERPASNHPYLESYRRRLRVYRKRFVWA
jgi:hypothetical protein